MLKKLLLCIQILAVVFSCAAPSFAYSDYADTEDTRLLSALNIMSGYTDGKFRPDRVLTRSEAVKILVNMRGYADEAQKAAKNTDYLERLDELPFNDLNKSMPYWTYWNLAYEMRLIQGFEDGTARPDAALKSEQFLKMLVNCTGYGYFAEKEGGYPDGYISYGKKLGIIEDIENGVSVTRASAADMVVKTMDVVLCVADGYEGSEPRFIISDGKEYPYRTLFEMADMYKAKVRVKEINGAEIHAVMLSSANFDHKAYTGAENYDFYMESNGIEMSENKEYNVLAEKTSRDNTAKYVLKFVFE